MPRNDSQLLSNDNNLPSFMTINSTKQETKKQPSFMTSNNTKEVNDRKEPLNQLEITDQQQQPKQQLSRLTLYEDPEGRFTLEYDPSLWLAFPDKNRFDDVKVGFADKQTGGKEVGMTVGIVKDPLPNLSIKEVTELALPNYIYGNEYQDKELEEEVECERMAIQGYDTCSFIYSQPKSYFDSYPRNYFMMVNTKIGNELWIVSFSAPGNKFEEFEQSVIQMINSLKITSIQ